MPHISKLALEKKVLDDIKDELVEVMSASSGSVNRKKFLRELLTGTEKIMLAKRLAIIFLLTKGVSPYEIWKTLKVSSSTVARIERNLGTKYKNLVKFVKSKANEDGLSGFIEKMLFGVLPAKTDNRWRWLDDL